MKRSLTKETINQIGQEVKLCGWVDSRRDHGKIIFIDLRDRWGIVQVVFTPQNKESYQLAQKLRSEWVVEIEGKVNERPNNMKNADVETGKIELEAKKIKILSEAKTPPFSLESEGYEISEEKRLKYRYLDIRRKRLLKNLEIRRNISHFIRNYLIKKDFLEIETPILTKSTPEGARDFLVPSRLQPGNFYALPQSPQQYKQLLMVAGVEKYFQFPKCFRDEDPRADRQAEFTQLDIEMSFVNQDEVLDLTEDLFTVLVKELFPNKKITQTPFERINYKEAIEKYGTDSPDLRKDKNNPDELAFSFIVNFPMFEKKKDGSLGAMHHPFTKPQTENLKEIKKNPEKILAFQYDLVLNGSEVAGGSIRSHKPKILEAVFEVLGHSKKEIEIKFGHLLKAFQYGVPPHGGIASGLDRFVQLMAGEENIREVMAFPKTGDNRDLMMEAPSEVDKEQLKELHLKIKNEK